MDLEQLRVGIYRHFAETGRAPDGPPLERLANAGAAEVEAGLRALEEQRHLALDDDGQIAMAHPFTTLNLGFSVMSESTLWWGGCAWDSFAIPHLVPGADRVLVATRCPACETAHAFNVTTGGPPKGDQVAHFRVPATHMWDDVVHTCGNQRIFCSEDCVADWLRATEQERGYVMDLSTLWRLAEHWYDGRLDAGYRRREPADAAEYLRSVGLRGPFWNL